MKQIIDSAFTKDSSLIVLSSKGIQDADFDYLLTQETKKVAKLDLRTC